MSFHARRRAIRSTSSSLSGFTRTFYIPAGRRALGYCSARPARATRRPDDKNDRDGDNSRADRDADGLGQTPRGAVHRVQKGNECDWRDPDGYEDDDDPDHEL